MLVFLSVGVNKRAVTFGKCLFFILLFCSVTAAVPSPHTDRFPNKKAVSRAFILCILYYKEKKLVRILTFSGRIPWKQ